MNLEESVEQLKSLIEAWQLNEADLNQTDINAIKTILKENKQLKDNWNELRKWIVYNKHNENTEQHYLVVDYGTLLGKMRELEQGSDSNE